MMFIISVSVSRKFDSYDQSTLHITIEASVWFQVNHNDVKWAWNCFKFLTGKFIHFIITYFYNSYVVIRDEGDMKKKNARLQQMLH